MTTTGDRFDPSREISSAFIARVCEWVSTSGEVFVVLRYLRSSGQRDYLFCRSETEFRDLVETLPVGTDTVVFQQPQLPLRGLCTPSLIDRALAEIPGGVEYLITRLRCPSSNANADTGWTGDSHAELVGDLKCLLGEEVAIGVCPCFNGPDSETMVSASKGWIDGPR